MSDTRPPNDRRGVLHDAMKVADVISRKVPRQDMPLYERRPGLVEGAASSMAVLALLHPLRSVALRAAGSQLRTFADLLVTTSQVMLAAQAGVYAFSLHGSSYLLRDLSKQTSLSPLADKICRDEAVEVILHKYPSSARAATMKPRWWQWEDRIETDFFQALAACRRRTAQNEESSSTRWF